MRSLIRTEWHVTRITFGVAILIDVNAMFFGHNLSPNKVLIYWIATTGQQVAFLAGSMYLLVRLPEPPSSLSSFIAVLLIGIGATYFTWLNVSILNPRTVEAPGYFRVVLSLPVWLVTAATTYKLITRDTVGPSGAG